MNRIILFLILFFSVDLYSQESRYDLELNFPVLSGNNSVHNSFYGLLDFGVNYRFNHGEKINFGLSFNTSLLDYNYARNLGIDNIEGYALLLNPRFFAELKQDKLPWLNLSTALGYSMFHSKISGDVFLIGNYSGAYIYNESNINSGVNLNLALRISIGYDLYLKSQFDFIKLIDLDQQYSGDNYYTDISMFKFGAGIML